MEFNYQEAYGDIQGTFIEMGLIPGRIIGWSKSNYLELNKGHDVYFNSNIFVLGEGKIWFGDIDLTVDKTLLEAISASIGKRLFILKEMDGRFENENLTDDLIISKAIAKIE